MLSFMDRESDGRSVIVVGVDFSETSDRAVLVARQLSQVVPNGEIHFVHVIPALRGPVGPGDNAGVMEAAFAQAVDRGRSKLEELQQAAALGIDARIYGHVRSGEADREIVQVASDVSADLIVVGTHGRTGIERLIVGSVAERVLRFAPCPVLAVRPKALPAWPAIEPPCPDCVKVQRETSGAKLWCERHSEHHPRGHSYREYPASFGVGSMSFRA